MQSEGGSGEGESADKAVQRGGGEGRRGGGRVSGEGTSAEGSGRPSPRGGGKDGAEGGGAVSFLPLLGSHCLQQRVT